MKRKLFLFLGLITAVSLMLGACAANEKATYDGGYYAAETESPREEAAYSSKNGGDFEILTDENAKIIWTGNLSMETTKWADTMNGLSDLFAQYGVQVISSEVRGGTSYESSGEKRVSARTATYVVRVPSANFKDFMAGFDGVEGAVVSSNTSSADKTKQYNQNELMLELLQTEYDDLKALLAEAKDLSEIMMVRDRMTEVMAEIRSYSNSNNAIDYDVEYSRVSLSVREVMVYSDPEKNESWFVRIGESFVEGAGNFIHFLGEAAVWIVGHIFVLILLGLCIFLPIFITKKANKKRRARLEAERIARENAAKAAEAAPAIITVPGEPKEGV